MILHQSVNVLVLCVAGICRSTYANDGALGEPCNVSVNPTQYLGCQDSPIFSERSRVPKLSRWGWWGLSSKTRVELATRWGYALEFGPDLSLDEVERAINGSSGSQKDILEVARKNPGRFKLAVNIDRRIQNSSWLGEAWIVSAKKSSEPQEQDKDFAISSKNVWSPEAPNHVFSDMGRVWANPISRLREVASIGIVLNGGEYGLSVMGFGEKYWQSDVRVVESKEASGLSWPEYISERKGRQEALIANEIRKKKGEDALLIYYHTGSETQRRMANSDYRWGYKFDDIKVASDLPSSSLYYGHYNTGWLGKNDLLTLALNSIGYQISRGAQTSYNWFNAGWERSSEKCGAPDCISVADSYVGFLKILFGAGTVGGVAGYFSRPMGGFDIEFSPLNPPSWLTQVIALSDVQAMWSFLMCFSSNGSLVPGTRRHEMSKDQPSYELQSKFPEGGARVVARKLNSSKVWLVVAWSPNGSDEPVSVELSSGVSFDAIASRAGAVYFVDGRQRQMKVELIDPGRIRPTTDVDVLRLLKSVEGTLVRDKLCS